MSNAYERLREAPVMLGGGVVISPADRDALLAVVEAVNHWRCSELPEWEITKAEDAIEAAASALYGEQP